MAGETHYRRIPGRTIGESLRTDAEGPFVCSVDGEPWPCSMTRNAVAVADVELVWHDQSITDDKERD